MKSPLSTIAVLAALLLASEARASDVDILFPLQWVLLSLVLLAALAPLFPLAAAAVVGALYALLVERRLALGLITLPLAAIAMAGVVAFHMGGELHDPSLRRVAIASMVIFVPVTWVLLWRGMISAWPRDKTSRGGIFVVVVVALWFTGEAALWLLPR